jgi:putative Mg2+ transporter-C (MgtC) family protein
LFGLDSVTGTMILRLVLAGVLGGLVGLEREVNKHPAGFRTHLLVGMGSCLIMVLSFYGFNNIMDTHSNIRFDPSRLPAYVISGIGFLGAGTILVQEATVRGLTTAASIWVVSAIGLVVGAGMYFIAIFTTIIVILSLVFLNKWEQLFMHRSKNKEMIIFINEVELSISDLIETVTSRGLLVKKLEVERTDEPGLLKLTLCFELKNGQTQLKLLDVFNKMDAVKKISTEN